MVYLTLDPSTIIVESEITNEEIAGYGLIFLLWGFETPASLAALAISPDTEATLELTRNTGEKMVFTVETASRVISEIIRHPENFKTDEAIAKFLDMVNNAS